eukprot:scaffold54757_cov60-Cyclotella_meneghiniana.AAC.1
MRELLAQGVKQAGLGIRNPVDCAEAQYDISKLCCEKLVQALIVGTRFNLGEHMQQVRSKGKHAKNMRVADEELLVSPRGREKRLREKHRLTWACKARIWPTCFPNQLNGTSISAEV